MARIYLAPDEEITGVIEKLRDATDTHVVLVVPKGTGLMQSIINIRLLKKKADELKKVLGIVAVDPISKHLASQVGLAVYERIEDVPKEDKVPTKKAAPEPSIAEPVIHLDETNERSAAADEPEPVKGVKIKQYERSNAADAAPSKPEVSSNVELPTAETEEIQPAADEKHAHITIPPEDDTVELDSDSGSGDVIIGKEKPATEEPVREHHRKTHLKPARRPLHIPRYVSIAGFVLVVLALLSGVAFAVVAPTATVVLHVPTESTKKSVTIKVDTNASSVDGTSVPGLKHEAEADGSAEVKSTGKKDVGEKAKGTVTMSNSWDSEAQSLPKGSILVAANGQQFRTQADVSIPGLSSTVSRGQVVITPGKADVSVEATEPGDQYNASPTTFKVQGFPSDKQAKITGANAKAFTGGTTKQLIVVASADVDQAKSQAKTNSEEASKKSLQQAVADTEMMLAKTIQASSEVKDANHQVGDEAASVLANAHAIARGVAVRKTDLMTVLEGIFKEGLAPAKSVIIPEVDSIDWTLNTKDNGIYELTKEIDGQIITTVDATAVQRFVAHKPISSIQESLKQQFGAESIDITVSPAGWPFAPILPSKIKVETSE